VRVPARVYEQRDEACASAAVQFRPSKTEQGREPAQRGRARTDERQDGKGQLEGEAAHDKALHGRVEHDHWRQRAHPVSHLLSLHKRREDGQALPGLRRARARGAPAATHADSSSCALRMPYTFFINPQRSALSSFDRPGTSGTSSCDSGS
jgi:hypothetical protein